ncbi:hypothetical protein D3C79_940200 [compost metagenome]
MQQPNQSVGGFDLHGNRQLLETFDEAQLLARRQVEKPATACRAVHLQVEAPAAQAGDRQRFVVTLHRM